MSTCISSHGEYSEHQLTDPAEPLTCQWCGAFDEDEANRRLHAARCLVGDWQSNGNSAHLGDPRADVWQKAARQLLLVLDGFDAHDWPPAHHGTPASEGGGEA